MKEYLQDLYDVEEVINIAQYLKDEELIQEVNRGLPIPKMEFQVPSLG